MSQLRFLVSLFRDASNGSNRILILIAMVFATVVCTARVAEAGPLTVTITPTSLTSLPGGTVTFAGTITNNTGIDLNATDLFLNFSGFDPSVVTTNQLLGLSDFVLANGSTSAVTDLFSIALTQAAVLGMSYPAEVFIQDVNNNLSNNVTVNVLATTTTTVPEPTTLILFGGGLIGAAIVRRRSSKTL